MLQGIGEIRNCLSTTSHGKFKQIVSIIFLTHNEIFCFHLCIKYKLIILT